MYVNKCTKCGAEFETKNPKRVICPNCLYPDKKMGALGSDDAPTQENLEHQQQSFNGEQQGQQQEQQAQDQQTPQQFYSSYSTEESNVDQHREYPQPQQDRGGYSQDRGGYGGNRGGYSQDRGGYGGNRGGYSQDRRPQGGGFNRGGFNNRRPQGGGFNNRRPQRRGGNKLLITRDELMTIEALYKTMLPLPNPDAHEVIATKMGIEPKKVFFGINLVRQKMMLPKLPYPKRKLAISPDQMFAIKNLYEPLLPLPPIGCHKIIASQLKMDEWRVHVGIGLIRSQLGMERWNSERTDIPDEMKIPRGPKAVAGREPKEEKAPEEVKAEAPTATETQTETVSENVVAEATENTEVAETPAEPTAPAEEKPKRGRKPKKTEDEQ